MIKYIVLAAILLFVAYCFGTGYGYGIGFKAGADFMSKFFLSMKNKADESNGIISSSEGSDRETP